MSTERKLHEARHAFRLKAWRDAYTRLSDADHAQPLDAKDLESLAVASYLVGKSSESNDSWSRAHSEYLDGGNVKGAIRCAFWLGFMLLNLGEFARGSGWIARARRLHEQAHVECVEEGYLLLPVALRGLGDGDAAKALQIFEQVARIGELFQDADLIALSLLGRGQAFIRSGQAQQGLSLLDEAMADVDSGALSPIVSGIVYCGVIEACLEIYDLARAREWTEALNHWCESQPDLVPFRGECLVRRSEIMQLHGDWPHALEEADRASTLLSQMRSDATAGAAFYQLGELHRLRGDYMQAEEAYRQSSRLGRNPQPGLALMRFAQGQLDSASTIIGRALREAKIQKTRARILPAYIEIMVATKKISAAQAATKELADISNQLDAPLLRAIVRQAEGSLLLAQGDARLALDKLTDAMDIWNRLGVAYASARVRVLVGHACTAIGDKNAAILEYETARSAFEQLGATPDISHIDAMIKNGKPDKTFGLTSRELEVLRFLATGKTNKTIAAEMFVSERTIDRHVSNILAKLNISTRAAATAYAYEHGLI